MTTQAPMSCGQAEWDFYFFTRCRYLSMRFRTLWRRDVAITIAFSFIKKNQHSADDLSIKLPFYRQLLYRNIYVIHQYIVALAWKDDAGKIPMVLHKECLTTILPWTAYFCTVFRILYVGSVHKRVITNLGWLKPGFTVI